MTIKITVPRNMSAGEVVELYSPTEAQFYMGCSAATLNRYRLEHYFDPNKLIVIGRGNYYTKESMDECLINLGRDRENINVEVIYGKSEGN